MLTGTVWGVTLIGAGLVATIAATQLLLAALFPRRMARMRHGVSARPVVCGLIGLPAAAVLVAIPAAVGKAWEFGGALGFSFTILVATFGLGAIAAEVGARLPSQGAAAHPWRSLLRGSVAVSFASMLPIAGWFAVFPLALLVGTGAWVRSFFSGDAAQAVSPPAPAVRRAQSAEPETAEAAA